MQESEAIKNAAASLPRHDAFACWVDRLKESVQALEKGCGNDTGHGLGILVDQVFKNISESKSHIPGWLSELRLDELEAFDSLLTLGEQLKKKLCRVQTPNAIKDLCDIISGQAQILESANLSRGSSPADSMPVTTPFHVSNSISDVMDYMSNVQEVNDDYLTRFCRLAYASSQYKNAKNNDVQLVNELLATERNQLNTEKETLSFLKTRFQNLLFSRDNSDMTSNLISEDSKILRNGMSLLYKDWEISKDELQAAIDEEARAKAAYERACQIRNDVSSRVSRLRKSIDMVNENKQIIDEVNSKRQDLSQYRVDTIEEFIGLLESVQKYLRIVELHFDSEDLHRNISSILCDTFSHSFLDAFQTLQEGAVQLSHFNILSKESSRPSSSGNNNSFLAATCISQLGLEMVRLWRQLNTDKLSSEVCSVISQVEEEISTNISTLSSITKNSQRIKVGSLVKATSSAPEYVDSTIVLYYDHLEHGTPQWHFECPGRTREVLKLLHQQKDSPVADDASKCRRLEFVNCNDVLSPPLWALPMTHSPSYLHRLHSLSLRSASENIFVPLEFDGCVGDDDDRLHCHDFFKESNYDESYSGMSRYIDSDLEKKILAILHIDPTDRMLARKNTLSQLKTKPVESSDHQDDVSKKPKIQFPFQKSSSVDIQPSARVNTPYGLGIAIEKTRAADNMQRIYLDWGADCHFNESSIQAIVDAQLVKESVGTILPDHVHRVLDAWRDDQNFKKNDEAITPFIRLIIFCLVNNCGMQRPVADMLQVNPSSFSAFLKSKASDTANKTILESAKSLLAETSFDMLAFSLRGEESAEGKGLGGYSEINRPATTGTKRKGFSEEALICRDFGKVNKMLRSSMARSSNEDIEVELTRADVGGDILSDISDDEDILQNMLFSTSTKVKVQPVVPKISRKAISSSSQQGVKPKTVECGGGESGAGGSVLVVPATKSSSSSKGVDKTVVGDMSDIYVDPQPGSRDGSGKRSRTNNNANSSSAQQGVKPKRVECGGGESGAGGSVLVVPATKSSSSSKGIDKTVVGDMSDIYVDPQPGSRDGSDKRSRTNDNANSSSAQQGVKPKRVESGGVESGAGGSVKSSSSSKGIDKTDVVNTDVDPDHKNDSIQQEYHGLQSKKLTDLSEPVTADVNELRFAVIDEILRRGITQTAAAEEANINIIGLNQTAISKFLHKGSFGRGEKAKLFKSLIEDWLKNSRLETYTSLTTKKDYASIIDDNPDPDITSLRQDLLLEMNRHGRTESQLLEESGLKGYGCSLSSLSQFLRNGSLEDKDPLFKKRLMGWLEKLTSRNATEIASADQAYLMLPIAVLRNEVAIEITRRKISERRVAVEAQLELHNIPSSSITRLVSSGECAHDDSGTKFRKLLQSWLKISRDGNATCQDVVQGVNGEEENSIDDTVRDTRKNELSTVRDDIHEEIKRRGIRQRQVLEESGLMRLMFGSGALSRFLSNLTLPRQEKGVLFFDKLKNWVVQSKGQDIQKSGVSVIAEDNLLSINELHKRVCAEMSLRKLNNDEMIKDSGLALISTLSTARRFVQEKHCPSGEIGRVFRSQLQLWLERRHKQGDSESESESEVNDNSHENEGLYSESCLPTALSNGESKQLIQTCDHTQWRGDNIQIPLYVVYAESFDKDYHFPFCKICNEEFHKNDSRILKCNGCPYGFHFQCYQGHRDKSPASNSNKSPWFCNNCRASGACFGEELRLSDIDSPNGLCTQPWALFYSSYLRGWKQGYVCDTDAERKLFLVKWWNRMDMAWAGSNWVNISNGAPVLWNPIISSFFDVKNDIAAKARRKAEAQLHGTNSKYFNRCFTEENFLPPQVSEETSQHQEGPPGDSDSVDQASSESNVNIVDPPEGDTDTFLSPNSLKAAFCAAGSACKAVDTIMNSSNCNAFVCTRPPGHHSGRHGHTEGCSGTGFCILNNAAIAMLYSRVRWGLQRVAVVDIDVHFGNGTAELLKGDPRAFFGCVHMIYGNDNMGFGKEVAAKRKTMAMCSPGRPSRNSHDISSRATLSLMEKFDDGFFPHALGCTEITDNYVSVGVYPKLQRGEKRDRDGNFTSEMQSLSGSDGFRSALSDIIIPKMESFDPELLIISAGFDGLASDPLGGDMGLTIDDFSWATHVSMSRANASGKGRVISLLEGGYDTKQNSLGLAKAANSHVKALRSHPRIDS